jgi:hypothetical protein
MPLPNAVANPIINDPFAEPLRHYDFSGASALLDGRRSASRTPSCAKAAGAHRWVNAVNYAGSFERWAYQMCRDVDALHTLIDAAVTAK